jgi:hypothetical protein
MQPAVHWALMVKLTIHVHLVLRLNKICGALPSLPHVSSWCGEGTAVLFTHFTDMNHTF